MSYLEIFFILLFLHALADFSLQTTPMAIGKNRNNDLKSRLNWVEVLGRKPEDYRKTWFYWLSAHSLIQGGLIMLVFGNIWIALIEVISHFTIDFIKCENKITPHQDQTMHLVLKIIYAIIIGV